MKEGLRSKILAIVFTLVMMMTSLVSVRQVRASENKEKSSNDSYSIKLLLDTIDIKFNSKTEEEKKSEKVMPSERQVKYYKLKDGLNLSEDKKINLISDIYQIDDEKQVLEYIKNAKIGDSDGQLSELSRFYGQTNPDGSIYANKFTLSKDAEGKEIENGIKEVIEISNLKKGTYLIVETEKSKANHPYNKITPTIVTLPEDIKDGKDLILLNKETIKKSETSLTLIKKDKDNGNPIEQAKFYLYMVKDNPKYKEGSKESKYIYTKVLTQTIAKGKYKFTGLETKENNKTELLETVTGGKLSVENIPNTYKDSKFIFREIEPAPGYNYKENINIENKDPISGGQTATIENSRPPMLKKINSANGKPLEGVVFNLYNENNKLIKFKKNSKGYMESTDSDSKADLVTDKTGRIDIFSIKNGKYYFQEVKTLEGFKDEKIKTEIFEVKNNSALDKDGKPKIILVENTPITPTTPEEKKGGHNFVKTDDTKDAKRLAGAVFKVQKVVDGKYTDVIRDGKIYTVTSSIDGSFYVDGLPYEGDGTKYALRETKAPDGYVQTSSVIEFTIDGVSKQNPAVFIKNKKNDIPPAPPTYNPPTTTYTPPDVPKIVRGPLVKTGDIKIIIMAIVGVLMIIVGKRLVVKSDRKLRAGIK